MTALLLPFPTSATSTVTGNAVFDGCRRQRLRARRPLRLWHLGLNGGSIKTSGLQTYTGAVTLAANTTLSSSNAGAIDFGGTVNGGYTLAVNTTGTTTFSGAVGNSTALVSLSTDAGGSTAINGGSMPPSGSDGMVFGDAVSLGAATTLTATNGAITFSDTLNGAQSLTLTAGTGNISFSDVVGGAQNGRLGAVTINQANNVTLSNAFSAASFSQASSTAGTGTFTLGGDLNTDMPVRSRSARPPLISTPPSPPPLVERLAWSRSTPAAAVSISPATRASPPPLPPLAHLWCHRHQFRRQRQPDR
jgi:hypothetical protein